MAQMVEKISENFFVRQKSRANLEQKSAS